MFFMYCYVATSNHTAGDEVRTIEIIVSLRFTLSESALVHMVYVARLVCIFDQPHIFLSFSRVFRFILRCPVHRAHRKYFHICLTSSSFFVPSPFWCCSSFLLTSNARTSNTRVYTLSILSCPACCVCT